MGSAPLIQIEQASGESAYARLATTNGAGPTLNTTNIRGQFYIHDTTTGSGDSEETHPGAPSQDGHWHHLVGVCDSTGTATVYVDSISAGPAGASVAPGGITVTQGPFIGYDKNTTGVGAHLNGTVSIIAVYNTPLTPAQIATH